LVTADEDVAHLSGEYLGEDASLGAAWSSSSSFSGTAHSAIVAFKVHLGKTSGEELGESLAATGVASQINLQNLQGYLEGAADEMGKIPRSKALKAILGMKGVPSEFSVAPTELIQTSAGWGRRRRHSAWKKKKKKALKKKKKKPVFKKKVVVKRKVVAKKKVSKKLPKSALDEAQIKAKKAVEMAHERQVKARKKAEKDLLDAQKEADKKKKLELAMKRRRELSNKESIRREKQMKIRTELAEKKAREAAKKAEQLQKAIEKAREAAQKEHIQEKKVKKALEIKGKKEREVFVKAAKEKAAKNIRELAMKKRQEIIAKFAGERLRKKARELRLKRKHAEKKQKATEKAKKQAEELARKTARESRQKNEAEKALKVKTERVAKKKMEINNKAEKERRLKAEKENKEKLKREKALKAAAARRIAEEKRAKATKEKAMKAKHEQAKKKAFETHQKLLAEQKQKIKMEASLKKARELREKKARELAKKKAMEVVRKVKREVADKAAAEMQYKKFKETSHKEKRKKANEKVDKVLASLRGMAEKLAKSRAIAKTKRIAWHDMVPPEKKLKLAAKHKALLAKELAYKIDGKKDPKKKKRSKCNLADNLANVKKTGLLNGKQGKCAVDCTLKSMVVGVEATCRMKGTPKVCRKFLAIRAQSVAAALMVEFDKFKTCSVTKKKKAVPKEEEYDLGEAISSPVHGGISVGEYVYSLQALQDEAGNVDAAKAVDVLLQCNKDGKKGDDELGEMYQPKDSKAYRKGAKGVPAKCKTNAAKNALKAITARHGKGCEAKCTAGGVSPSTYTAECSGSGTKGCFVAASEQYHRQVMSTYYGWKAECAEYF